MIFSTIFLIILFILSFYIVADPLLKKEVVPHKAHMGNEKVSMETIYTTLNELEFDYLTNKLSKEDYEQMSSQYKNLAAKMMKEEEEKGIQEESVADMTKQVELEIEKEIREQLSKLKQEKRG
ncbi:hypothetical protein L1765_14440 [Microaerobacter geothermalis]|uniref:hypothetical protein n=1 Tax=Microaerobacter geothermalis TaxID=674972 RepID=UPI001F455F31|nr:hypothetical protein [Microaerobacter geothermalis]MCF6095159.1 hypothetical protein [Microaerobacter geothermalis]